MRLESGGVACGRDSSRKTTKVKSNEANLCFMKEASDTLKINNPESGLICNHYSCNSYLDVSRASSPEASELRL